MIMILLLIAIRVFWIFYSNCYLVMDGIANEPSVLPPVRSSSMKAQITDSTPSWKVQLLTLQNRTEQDLKVLLHQTTNFNNRTDSIHSLATCNPTVGFQLLLSSPSDAAAAAAARTSEFSTWSLQSLDDSGVVKQVGGDELYVTLYPLNDSIISDPHGDPKAPLAVAHVQDLQNGNYQLQFVVPPLISDSTLARPREHVIPPEQPMRLQVILQYTCGMGQMEPPTKQTWITGGHINAHFATSTPLTTTTSTTTITPIIQPIGLSPLSLWPQLTIFHLPTYPQSLSNLKQFKHVLVFGDSLMGQLVGDTSHGYNNISSYYQSNIRYGDNILQPLNKYTRNQWLVDIRRYFGSILRHADVGTVALLLGSSTWDLLDQSSTNHDWYDHISTCRRLLQTIQQSYPNVTIVWRLPTAMHIHVIPWMDGHRLDQTNQQRLNRIRYMSTSRTYKLYQAQRELLTQRRFQTIQIMDLYEASYLSAHWTLPQDGRHFQPRWNQQVLSWFYDR